MPIYGAFVQGRPSPLADPVLHYADYAAWQREWLSGAVLERELSYWRGQLQGIVPLELPTDRRRPAVQTLPRRHPDVPADRARCRRR